MRPKTHGQMSENKKLDENIFSSSLYDTTAEVPETDTKLAGTGTGPKKTDQNQ